MFQFRGKGSPLIAEACSRVIPLIAREIRMETALELHDKINLGVQP